MYPRNAASPPRIAIGAVVQISDGAVQTSGCTVRILEQGGTEGDGAGTTAYSTDGIVLYTPTQAETDQAAFILIAKKTGCIPISQTIVTSASDVAGYAGVDWSKVNAANSTVSLSATTVATVTTTTTATNLTNLPSIPANWLTAAGIAASALNGKGDWNIGKTGYSLTATTGLGNQTANLTGNLSGSVGSVTAVSNGAITSTSFATGAITSDAFAASAITGTAIGTGAITAAKIQSDAIGAAEIAADAVTKIAQGIRTELTTELARIDAATSTRATQTSVDTVAGYLDTEVAAIKSKTDNLPASPAASGDIPSAGAIADAVWDEAISGHLTAGSTGNALNASGSAGDPWSTLLPGAYGSGTAGKIIGDNLNATVSSRATQTSLDDVPTNAELTSALATADDAVLAVLGTPAGASLAADVASVKGQTAAIEVDTQDLQGRLPTALVSGKIDASVGAMAANVMTAAAAASDLTTELQSGLATASALSTVAGYLDTEVAAILAAVDTEVAAIKAKTDSLTFTVAGQVDANIQLINDVALTGNGQSGTEFGV